MINELNRNDSSNTTIDLNSTYGNFTGNCKSDMPGLYLIVQFLYIIVCILGLFGNTLVIYVVLRFSKMQTVTNMYIVNLAIADECFLIGIPFLIVTMNLQSWPFGDVLCKFYMASTSINQFTSSIFLMIMSADRYVAVCHPITAPKIRTPFISKIVSLTAWTVSAILMIPVLMYSNTMIDENNVRSCNILWPDEENLSGHAAFTLYSSILGFAIPLALIFVFYLLVIRKLRTVGPKNKSKEKKRSHRKVTKLVLTVITVYVLCWLPYWVTQVALIFTPAKQCQSKLTVIIFLITGCLSYSNSAMNPILYAFLSDNFKKSFLKACICAAGKDVNATLHLENSVFPRKQRNGGSERIRTTRGTTAIICQNGVEDEEMGETGLLVSRVEHSTAITSRSNVTITSDAKENSEPSVRNGGIRMNVPPTQL
ncbi:hypothetical protein PGB90_001255 [Kerria lacca]